MRAQRQVERAGVVRHGPYTDMSIFDEPVVLINQRGKLVELRAEYAVFNQSGRQIAAVRGKRMTTRMQVVDLRGQTLLDVRREASLVSSKIIVTGPDGAKVGRLVTSMNWNKADRLFKLEDAHDEQIGAIYRDDRARRREFNAQDAVGGVIGGISKTHAGLAKELFTKGDNYVVSFQGQPDVPLRALTIASAIVIDLIYHQK